MNNNGNGRFRHNSCKKRAIAIKHCASKFVEALPQRPFQVCLTVPHMTCRVFVCVCVLPEKRDSLLVLRSMFKTFLLTFVWRMFLFCRQSVNSSIIAPSVVNVCYVCWCSVLQLEQARQREGSRACSLHRQTSDLCESDVRQMNHADLTSSSDDDDEDSDTLFDDEDVVTTPTNHNKSKSKSEKRSLKSSSSANAAPGRVPMKPKGSMSAMRGTTSGAPALDPPGGRKTMARGGANLFDLVDKAFENTVAPHDSFAEFMASGGSGMGVSQRFGTRGAEGRQALMRLTSNDKYVLDYGARFRELMDDHDVSTEAKCWRLYA